MSEEQSPRPRDADHWAKPVDRLHVGEVAEGASKGGVEGRRLTGPLNGFGKLWQKTYRVEVGSVPPEEVIRAWKEHYDEFWPPANHFYAPLAGMAPGEVGLIRGGVGPIKLSTGVMVIYADDVSFSYMTPEGHPFAGIITFSSHQEAENRTIAQVQLLIRANDPAYELAFPLFSSRAEDRMWQHTLGALAAHFGSPATVETRRVCVDRKRAWKNFWNIRHNAAFSPVRALASRGKE